MLACTSGPDNTHGDIHLTTAAGRHLRTPTAYAGPDESPDWQAIPAPRTARRGGLVASGPSAYDIRAVGRGLDCPAARTLARRWTAARRPARVGGFRAVATGFRGVRRVVLRRGDGAQRRLVAFLGQP